MPLLGRFLFFFLCLVSSSDGLLPSLWHSKSSQPKASRIILTMSVTKVALTREAGKNGKLAELLEAEGLATVEIPCIAHSVGADRDRLPTVLKEDAFDYVVVTSPEAAAVLLEGWKQAGSPPIRVASIGESTSTALHKGGIEVAFEPSKATAKTLAQELPEARSVTEGGGSRVLYPASARAATTLQNGLAHRGFEVYRLDTYNTEPAAWAEADLDTARSADIVAFASPSAVKVWAERVGTVQPVACIGETSAAASRNAGFGRVAFPSAPGMAGWVSAVLEINGERVT